MIHDQQVFRCTLSLYKSVSSLKGRDGFEVRRTNPAYRRVGWGGGLAESKMQDAKFAAVLCAAQTDR